MALQVEFDSIYNAKGYVCKIIRNNMKLKGTCLHRLIQDELHFYEITEQHQKWIDELQKRILIKDFIKEKFQEIKTINKNNVKKILKQCITHFTINIQDPKQKKYLKDCLKEIMNLFKNK